MPDPDPEPEPEPEAEPVDAGALEADALGCVEPSARGGLAGAGLAGLAGAGFAGAGFAGAGLDEDLLLGSHLPPAQTDDQSRS